jgi:hypothetical protein
MPTQLALLNHEAVWPFPLRSSTSYPKFSHLDPWPAGWYPFGSGGARPTNPTRMPVGLSAA